MGSAPAGNKGSVSCCTTKCLRPTVAEYAAVATPAIIPLARAREEEYLGDTHQAYTLLNMFGVEQF